MDHEGRWLGIFQYDRKESDHLEKMTKGENSEKIRKGLATNVVETILVLVPRAANGGNRWYTKNPKKVL